MPSRLTTLLFGALLAVPALAAAGTATAAPTATAPRAVAAPGASRVPSLVRDQVAKIRQELSRHGATALSAQQARALSGGFLPVRTDGGIDLQLHALGPVGAAQAAQLRSLGATVLGSSADFAAVPGAAMPQAGLIHAVVPYNRVDAVAGLSWVAAVRPTIRPAVDAGAITSEGVTLHNATAAQNQGFTGAGQKIGVISDGTTSIAESIARGELPGTVQVLDAGEGDEGTAMLEIIHDMAPGAQLAFNTVGEDLTSYVAAFHNLAAAGSTMIAEDIAFDDEPAFQQGLGATTAEELARHGIWVSSSAGNLGNRHAPRGLAVGTGSTPDGVTGDFAHCPSAPRNTVNLRGSDNTYDVTIRAGGAILPTLQWSEPRAIFPTAGQGGFTDLNLYLMTGDGRDCLAVSNAVQANGVGGFGAGTCPANVQGDCRFFGTSAAAPSAAGVAALVRQQYGSTTAPRDLNSIMTDLAFPRAGAGWGAGVLRAI